MGVVAIVHRQPPLDAFLELRGTGEVAPLEESPAQDAEEQFHLVEPRTVDRSEVEHMFVIGILQELSALSAGL
jgi:hypothetical protein